ncbi:winged helix-turn-helix domain-containing protein [Nonomuraea sp. SYSU D8015]|uniref:winged helix-turn-helix domain-containing protein n=1 Tax=Nonomuraea sp. SYSU D8015 TaxID=2593644 RepID=UPI001660E3F6|nr:helix-turn-helix domain-containing protein [Nonomuraea sp. SYSU D8015]
MALGTLKIVFTAEDLARVRIAPRPDPMWEMVLSLHLLQARGGGTAMAIWRRQVRDILAETGLLTQVRGMLIPLAPAGPYFPDFLTPAEAQSGLDHGVKALVETPRRRIRHELGLLQTYYGLPPGLEDLARGNARAIRDLGRVACGYIQAAFAPHLQQMEHTLGRERSALARHLADDGVEQMLDHLPPMIRWRPPVLEADYPARAAQNSREIHLRGRGLTLIPSYFCRVTPVALVDQGLPPVLVYPARRWTPAAAGNDPLVELLGRTRAETLRCIAATPGCTTTELARRTGSSLANASKHAQVLRQAGLITSIRQVNLMLHQATALGTELVRAQPPDEPRARL